MFSPAIVDCSNSDLGLGYHNNHTRNVSVDPETAAILKGLMKLFQVAVPDRSLGLQVDFQAALETCGVMALSAPSGTIGAFYSDSDKDLAMAGPVAKEATLTHYPKQHADDD